MRKSISVMSGRCFFQSSAACCPSPVSATTSMSASCLMIATSPSRTTVWYARIIVLTTYDGDEDIYRGMRAGARPYLLKDVRREDLLQCIREVHAGRAYLPPAVAAKLAERLPTEALTPRELDVLRLLAVGKPNKLIGADLAIPEVTVKRHVQSLFKKLNVLSRTEAIAVANRRGLLHL